MVQELHRAQRQKEEDNRTPVQGRCWATWVLARVAAEVKPEVEGQTRQRLVRTPRARYVQAALAVFHNPGFHPEQSALYLFPALHSLSIPRASALGTGDLRR